MTATGARREPTSRSDWGWLVLPYLVVVGTTVHGVVGGDLTDDETGWALGVGAVLVGWHTFFAVANRRWLERALAPMAAYYLGMIALCLALLQLSFSYFALYLVCYALAFVALPGVWAYVGLVLAGVVPLVAPGPLQVPGTNVLAMLAGLAVAGLVGWSIRRLESETAARRAALADLGRAHEDLGRTHADLEQVLAENLALRDRLVAEARESGIAEERARIAADIHDTLAAALTGIVSQLEALDAEGTLDAGGGAGPGARARLRTATDLARDALREARASIRALRPAVLREGTLRSALAALVAEADPSADTRTRLRTTGTEHPVPGPVEDAVVRIARECLTNARRHASAEQVHVTLSYLGDAVALDVADDGAGFDPRTASTGHGLDIMAERARGLGGTLDVRSAPGQGTTVTATLPVSAEEAGPDRRAATSPGVAG